MNDTTGQEERAQLELLYAISRSLASELELREVLQRVLFASLEHVGGERASIVVLDDQGNPLDGTIVYQGQLHTHTTRQLRETIERGLAGWVVRNRQAALVTDTRQDDRWLQRPDDAELEGGSKSAICVPLLARKHLVGVLTLVHPRPHTFDESDLALMQSIADQAGIAVLNARLYAESQRQARVMSALAESAISINASLQLENVLDKILQHVNQALQVEAAFLLLQEGDFLVIKRALGQGSHHILGLTLPRDEGVFGNLYRSGKPSILLLKDSDDLANGKALPGLSVTRLACAPLRVGHRVIGLLAAVNPMGGEFERDTLLVLTGIGSLAGIAIQNARLFEQLNAAHRRYRELFEESIDPIVLTDLDGHVLEVNRMAVRTLGLEPGMLKEMTIDQLHEVHWAQVGMDFELVDETTSVHYESALYRRKGTLSVEVYVHRVRYEDSVFLRWTFRDITERKELDMLRNDMISMIYHDLRSPLANVVSSLDLLKTLIGRSDDQIEAVMRIAEHSIGRIQRLLNSLLDLNRLEAGQPIVTQEAVAVETLIRDAVLAVEPQAAGRQQRVKTVIEKDLPPVWAAADMILRVLTNLAENAIKFSPAESTIEVGARREGDMAVFWVRDEGPGIPPEQKEHIFDKFYRVQSGRNNPKGLGIGLAFCRLAVTGHGGKIWVESTPGKGSTFYFTLPFAPPGSY